jgi:lipopolysaccharide biosynthesis glycosyltransferase
LCWWYGFGVTEVGDVADDGVRVALAADDNYVRPLCVAARSVVANLSPDRSLTIHVLDTGISAENQARVRSSLASPRVTIEWVDDLHRAVSDLPTYGFFSTAAYSRLLLPQLLPDSVDRVVYLDCDTLTRRCLSGLYDLPLEDGVAALGVPDMGAPFVSCPWGLALWYETGRKADEFNFNSGVLLINLRMWREEGIADDAFDYVRSDRHQYNLDQEAINAIAGTRIKAIDPRWNQQGELYHQQSELALPYTREVLESVRRDPWIIHYSNVDKPWHFGSTHPWVSEWYRYLDQTEWSGWRPSAPPMPVRVLRQVARVGRKLATRFS